MSATLRVRARPVGRDICGKPDKLCLHRRVIRKRELDCLRRLQWIQTAHGDMQAIMEGMLECVSVHVTLAADEPMRGGCAGCACHTGNVRAALCLAMVIRGSKVCRDVLLH